MHHLFKPTEPKVMDNSVRNISSCSVVRLLLFLPETIGHHLCPVKEIKQERNINKMTSSPPQKK